MIKKFLLLGSSPETLSNLVRNPFLETNQLFKINFASPKLGSQGRWGLRKPFFGLFSSRKSCVSEMSNHRQAQNDLVKRLKDEAWNNWEKFQVKANAAENHKELPQSVNCI